MNTAWENSHLKLVHHEEKSITINLYRDLFGSVCGDVILIMVLNRSSTPIVIDCSLMYLKMTLCGNLKQPYLWPHFGVKSGVCSFGFSLFGNSHYNLPFSNWSVTLIYCCNDRLYIYFFLLKIRYYYTFAFKLWSSCESSI